MKVQIVDEAGRGQGNARCKPWIGYCFHVNPFIGVG
jgi:hypothetical protein